MTTSPSPSSYVMAFREWFGLTRAQSELLLALYDAHGELLTSRDLAAATGVAAGSVPFHLVDIRAALEAEGLDTERGKGYRLTEEGLEECRNALMRIGEELRLAG
jgi:DNA-binding winged helix-turn-helix (wHTH) protein